MQEKKYQKAFQHNISESYLKSGISVPRDFSDIFIQNYKEKELYFLIYVSGHV